MEKSNELQQNVNSPTFFEMVLEFGVTIKLDTLELILRSRCEKYAEKDDSKDDYDKYMDMYKIYLAITTICAKYEGKYYMRTLFNNAEFKQDLINQCKMVKHRTFKRGEKFESFECGIMKLVNKGMFFRLREVTENLNFLFAQLDFYEKMKEKAKEGALSSTFEKEEDERPEWDWTINKSNLAVFKMSDPLQILSSTDIAKLKDDKKNVYAKTYLEIRCEHWEVLLQTIHFIFQRMNYLFNLDGETECFSNVAEAIEFPYLHSQRMQTMMGKFKTTKSILLAKNNVKVNIKDKVKSFKIDYSGIAIPNLKAPTRATRNAEQLNGNAKNNRKIVRNQITKKEDFVKDKFKIIENK